MTNDNHDSIFTRNVQRGIDKGIITVAGDGSKITYHCKREYTTSFKNPEEKVRGSYFCELVLDYNYPTKNIDIEVTVPRRTPEDRADIVVYDEDGAEYLIIECKKDGITDAEFKQAIEQDLEDEGIIQIRPTNISKTRQLIFDKCIYIKVEKKEALKSYLLQKGEILFNNTNSQELVGKSVYFNIDGDYFCSNHITRLMVDTVKVNPVFLTQLLNIYQLKNLFFRICTNWNNQSGVNGDLLKTVKFPLPPIAIQNKIAEEVKNRRQKVEQLQKEAKEELEKAKQEVERIILGLDLCFGEKSNKT